MNDNLEHGTALLAAFFGSTLLSAAGGEQSTTVRSAHNAREIAVLARVLEKRLGEVRKSMVDRATSKLSKVLAREGH